MSAWPEVTTAKAENRHEIKLAGAHISQRISETGLDTNLFQLQSLNLLNISDTCLISIPDEIKLLTNLQSLLLFGNKLTDFNENITSLSKLKVLDLSRNQLCGIPHTINKMKELTSINLSSNQIDKMPKFEQLPNLISVDVSNNKLTLFLDVETAVLKHLTDLKLKGNLIESVPSYVAQSMPSLKNFDIGDNQLKVVPGEIANLSKLKEFNLKGNKLADKRLMKLVDQCRTKQVLDYIRDHCPKSDQTQPVGGKGKGKKGSKKQDEPCPEDNMNDLCHSMTILHVEDDVLKVKIVESEVSGLQTRLHDTVCDKRNAATIATHDLSKIAPGDLVYTAKPPTVLKLTPLSRVRPYTGEQLFQQLIAEAEALRKEKKRNVYSGIHKFLYLLEGKPKYPCLEDASGTVISFPPITNSDSTKMSVSTKRMLVEVTSQASLGACKAAASRLLQDTLLLGVGSPPGADRHSLSVQQMKVVDVEGNLKSVYPSRTDCVFEGSSDIKIYRLPKK
ncbi:hypothetical protein ACJJTC_016502 [Scirpophaga incertulas]